VDQDGDWDGDGAVYVDRVEPIYVDGVGDGHRDREEHGHLHGHWDGHGVGVGRGARDGYRWGLQGRGGHGRHGREGLLGRPETRGRAVHGPLGTLPAGRLPEVRGRAIQGHRGCGPLRHPRPSGRGHRGLPGALLQGLLPGGARGVVRWLWGEPGQQVVEWVPVWVVVCVGSGRVFCWGVRGAGGGRGRVFRLGVGGRCVLFRGGWVRGVGRGRGVVCGWVPPRGVPRRPHPWGWDGERNRGRGPPLGRPPPG